MAIDVHQCTSQPMRAFVLQGCCHAVLTQTPKMSSRDRNMKGFRIFNGGFYFKTLPNNRLDGSKVKHYNADLSYDRSSLSLEYHQNPKHTTDANQPP